MTNMQNSQYMVNDIVKSYLKDLYKETMFKKFDMSSNLSVLFNAKTGHLVVEYIGYNGTDFHNGQYFILFELPEDYPQSPPKISVLTESGRFHVKRHLSLSITHFHKELWYSMPLTFLVVNMLSAFSDYSIMGIGHHPMYSETTTRVTNIKELVEKTREYNEKNYPDLYEKFKIINELKTVGTDIDIQAYIDKQTEEF